MTPLPSSTIKGVINGRRVISGDRQNIFFLHSIKHLSVGEGYHFYC